MRLRAISTLVIAAGLSAALYTSERAHAAAAAAAAPAAPTGWVTRDTFDPTPRRLIYTAARSLGMLRGVAEEDTLVRIRYQGSGTAYRPAKTGPWAAAPLKNYYVEISFPEKGMRVDETGPDGRQVHVVAGDKAWDEKDVAADGPPVGKSETLVPAAMAQRQLELAVTPYEAIRAAHAVQDKVQVTPLPHGTFLLTFPFQGQVMKVTLDRNRRPSRVELPINHPILGKTTLVAEYSDYKDYEPISDLSDEPFSDLFFPGHVVHKLGDKTTLDVKISTCWCVNPYVIFPAPNT